MLISLTWRAFGLAVLFALAIIARPGGAGVVGGGTGNTDRMGSGPSPQPGPPTRGFCALGWRPSPRKRGEGVRTDGQLWNPLAPLAGRGQGEGSYRADPLVRDAIVAAVKARMGNTASVTVGEMRVRGLETIDGMAVSRMVAVPDAGSRVGGFVRFLLYEDAKHERRAGSVDAEVHVTAPHVRARRALPHRTVLEPGDLERVTGDVGRMPLEALPDERMLAGARVTRPIAEGRPIVASMVASTQLVKSGDEVRTIVRIGALEARGSAIAAQSGTLGDEIRVVNADSKRALKVRVTGEGEVEVIHER